MTFMAAKHEAVNKTRRSNAGPRSNTGERKNDFRSSYLVLYEAAPEGGYVAMVPALPGCHSQGDTLDDAEVNIHEAIEVYLESLIAHGDPIPEEKRLFQGIVTVSLPDRG
jgi:predicted RNase H-like HicB family nuclease